MPTYLVRLYSPFTLKTFALRVEAPTAELAKKKILGKTVTDPDQYEFDVEDYYIISVAPVKVFPMPPYELMPEEKVKEAKWLKGAIVEEPLPKDAEPAGSPKLATVIPDSIVTLLYEQEVKSREYPEKTWKIKYRRDIFTKFYEEAKRMARRGKIEEAVRYLVEHCPGITVRMIADILEIGYWTAYRAAKSWMAPEAAKILEKEAEETATLEKWLPEQITQVKEQAPTKEPKIVAGPLWRGQITLWPYLWKKESELLEELKHILTLEGYPTLTKEEEQELKKKLHEYWQAKTREKLTAFF
jgi:hypothetical protein